jgi:hypothetical protein
MRMLTRAFTTAERLARAVWEDPFEMAIEAHERVAERAESRGKREHGAGFMPWPPCPYAENDNWEVALHELLALPWPCPDVDEFTALWPQVTEPFTSGCTAFGRGAFAGWGDGEPGLARALWCITRHLRPSKVVETGVARGITSRFILEALEANGDGHLWSVDRPPPGRPDLHQQIGCAIPGSLRGRWSYVQGSSRRRLGKLLRELGEIDLFVHDSRHSARNLLFELELARTATRSGGFLVADDVDMNCGLHAFRARHPHDGGLVCAAEPLEPDPGRQGDRGVFAVLVKSL